MNLTDVILPEIILVVVACALFLLGTSSRIGARRGSAMLALVAMIAVIVVQGWFVGHHDAPGAGGSGVTSSGGFRSIQVGPFANYVKLIPGIMGTLFVLLAWPTNRDATGSRSLDFGRDA